MKAKEICYEKVKKLFYYDESSKSCIRHLSSSGNKRTFYGKEAGYACKNKRKQFIKWVVTINGSHYNAARVVWILHHGFIDSLFVVDHIDGDPSNNRISNLRLVKRAVNNRNQKTPVTNTSGVIGVSRKSNGRGRHYWCAHWREVDGTQSSKNFSIDLLGEEVAFQLAVEERQTAIKRLIELGANYHENHGRFFNNLEQTGG